MNIGKISKAIAAGIGGGIGGAAATSIVATAVIPGDVQAPWWGYVVAYAVAVAVPSVLTYLAPKNAEPQTVD